MVRHQTVRIPLFTPTPAAEALPDGVLETSPLYAGETVARIRGLAPAGAITRDLAGLS